VPASEEPPPRIHPPIHPAGDETRSRASHAVGVFAINYIGVQSEAW
jgi:hypothetical protein